MKRCSFLLIAWLFIAPVFSQVAYYDAGKLMAVPHTMANNTVILNYDASNTRLIVSVLLNYIPASDTVGVSDEKVALQKVARAFRTNPFLTIGTTAQDPDALLNLLQGKSFSAAPASFLSSVGGINVTNFADGLAKFLIKRFKEELTITFFQKFKEDIAKSEELKALFPETYKVLQAIDKDIYRVSVYLNTLRESFVKDLTNLYKGFKTFTQLTKYKPYFDTHKSIKTVITTALSLIDQYTTGTHPGDALARFAVTSLEFDSPPLQQNIRSSILLIQAFSASFKSLSSDHYWVPADSIRILLKNDIARNIYFGLMYQKYGAISFYKNSTDTVRLDSCLKEAKKHASDIRNSIDKYSAFIETLADHTQEVNEYITGLRSRKKEEIDYNDYHKLFNASLDLFQHAFSFVELPFVQLEATQEDDMKQQANRWLFVARSAGELYVDVRVKNYSSAVLNAVGIVDTMLVAYHDQHYIDAVNTQLVILNSALTAKITGAADRTSGLEHTIKKKITEYVKYTALSAAEIKNRLIADGITDTAIREDMINIILTMRSLDETNATAKLTALLLKYGSFASAVAAAQNSNDVQAAIEAIALPAGSARIKRESTMNISLNAFAGVFGGHEFITNVDNKVTANSFGITAPVGISFSRGSHTENTVRYNKNTGKVIGGKSNGLFISLIDVGVVTALRFGDTTSTIPMVQLKDIISPGVFYSLGFGKCPISMNAGLQYGPTLRQLSPTSPNISDKGYLRISISFLVDIPLLNFYTKSK